MKKILFFLTVVFAVFVFLPFEACVSGNEPECFDTTVYGQTNFRAEVFKIETGGYGYEIFVDGKKIIRQDCIPAVEGNNTFKTGKDALRVGRLVVIKMILSPDFPSVTIEELEKLNVIEKNK